MDGHAPAKIWKAKGGSAIAPVGRSEEREERLILCDRQKGAVAPGPECMDMDGGVDQDAGMDPDAGVGGSGDDCEARTVNGPGFAGPSRRNRTAASGHWRLRMKFFAPGHRSRNGVSSYVVREDQEVGQALPGHRSRNGVSSYGRRCAMSG